MAEFEESDILWPDTPKNYHEDGDRHVRRLSYSRPRSRTNLQSPKPQIEEFKESDILWLDSPKNYHEDGDKLVRRFSYNLPRSRTNPLSPKPQIEEFTESDILWPDTPEDHCRDGNEHIKRISYDLPDESPDTRPTKPDGRTVSSPIDIPKKAPAGRPSWVSALAGTVLTAGGESAYRASASMINGGQNFVPPHVVVARRINKRKMVFMIYGKTLQGRRSIIPQHVR